MSALASAFPEAVSAVVREPTAEGAARLGRIRDAVTGVYVPARAEVAGGAASAPIREDVRAPLRTLTADEPGRLPAATAVARVTAAAGSNVVRRPRYLRRHGQSPSRIDLLELDIDLRLSDLWREAGEITDWNLDVVAAFMRAAYGKGYCDALTEDRRARSATTTATGSPAARRRAGALGARG